MAAVPMDEPNYRRRVLAWTMYDWANSAFATTILAAVLPVYFSQVAGANLPSDTIATGYFGIASSIALLIAAVISPILGTISDVMRGKKQFLVIFAAIGIFASAAFAFTSTGDWLLVLLIFVIGRVGFQGSISFYDSLLPHVAKEDDQDRVSAWGYALGYLGGGILLAINAYMIIQLGVADGARLSFISVAIWWTVFTIPLLIQVPEPMTAVAKLKAGENVVSVGFARIRHTLRDISKYSELLKFLIAFLIYNDAIGTIITTAAIYGAELGFGSTSLILAILLVQFVGIPFSLIFGGLPNPNNKRRPLLLAFILFNLVMLPLAGIVSSKVLPQDMTGVLLPPYETTANGVGTGVYKVEALNLPATWTSETISAATLGADSDVIYANAGDTGERLDFPFIGQEVKLTYAAAPNYGVWAVLIDGQPVTEAGEDDQLVPVVVDAYHETVRYGETAEFSATAAGEHVLSLVNTGTPNPSSSGNGFAVAQIDVLAPVSQSNLGAILGTIIALQIAGLGFAFVTQGLFAGLAQRMDTKHSIVLALIVYATISVWGFILNSTIEFWFLAWMVAIVQGGSQALSRSLFSVMSPKSKSGEFFGVFGVMEKFASFVGPLIFSFAALNFGSSRPAILSLIVFFIIGGFLLLRVNVDEGRRVAQEEDKAALDGAV
jgi:MFS transporter, UMF1 family